MTDEEIPENVSFNAQLFWVDEYSDSIIKGFVIKAFGHNFISRILREN